jgi:hypothetical protein
MSETGCPTTSEVSDVNAPERAGLCGLGVLTVVSAYVLLASPDCVQAARHVQCGHNSPTQWVTVPHVEVGVTAAPAVTTPAASIEFPPPHRDPMVIATAVIRHHHLVVTSLRGGLYGP